MEAIKELVKDVKLPPTTKNTEYCVEITHLINPHSFYVRPMKFSKLIENIEKTPPSNDDQLLDVYVNKKIIFNMNEFGKPKYARGEICTVGYYGCTVFALDYGFTKENVSFEFMWECDECLIDMEQLVINCRLANCGFRRIAPYTWDRAIEAFRRYIGDEPAHMKIVDATFTQLVVELYNTCANDIAKMLILSGPMVFEYDDMNEITPSATPPTEVFYEFKQLELNDDLHVRVVSGRSLDGFYVVEMNDYLEYLKEQENIDSYAKKAKAVEKKWMKCGDSVLIWRGGCSYDRGYIKEIYSDCDTVLVQMVDTGNYKTVPYQNLKVIPEQCVKMPAVAIYCCVKGKVTYDLNLLFHPGRQFIITVHKLGNQIYFEKPSLVTISHYQQQ